MAIQVEVWGDYACFARCELKTERVSYDVMTPSAARGLLDSLYWHPGLRWVIDRIHVCAPIRFTNIRRNEVKSTLLASSVFQAAKGGKAPALYTAQEIQQRAAMVSAMSPSSTRKSGVSACCPSPGSRCTFSRSTAAQNASTVLMSA